MDKPALPKLRLGRRDYWHIGPVYVWKWLVVLLLIGAALAVLAAFGLPSSLTAPHEREPPTYCYTDKRLAETSGVVRITDDAGTVRYEGEIAQGAITVRAGSMTPRVGWPMMALWWTGSMRGKAQKSISTDI